MLCSRIVRNTLLQRLAIASDEPFSVEPLLKLKADQFHVCITSLFELRTHYVFSASCNMPSESLHFLETSSCIVFRMLFPPLLSSLATLSNKNDNKCSTPTAMAPSIGNPDFLFKIVGYFEIRLGLQGWLRTYRCSSVGRSGCSDRRRVT